MDFERTGNIKKAVGIGHQAINLKCIFVKMTTDENFLWLSNDETREILQEISKRGFIPWWIINNKFPKRSSDENTFEFILINEDDFQLNANKEKIYKRNNFKLIRGQKVIFGGKLFDIPKDLS